MSVVALDDYVVFCDGLRGLCGIDLSQYKRPQMERRLRAFFARKGVSSLADGVGLLRSDTAELEELLDRVTINVSQLWRHPEQFQRLKADVLPELARTRQIRAWSAGCSYGAEAYTLAAVCHETVPGCRVSIQGTDIDKRMIARAQKGLFSAEDARGIAPAQMQRGFERVAEGWQARPELQRMTQFRTGDLLRLTPRTAAYDLVMCRNTVIYFEQAIRDELHLRLAKSLRTGGYLVIGATERVADPAALELESTHPFIYRKR